MIEQLAVRGLGPSTATEHGYRFFHRPPELGYAPGGDTYTFPRLPHDCGLPWPYCPPINVVWHNSVGMPIEFIPGWMDG